MKSNICSPLIVNEVEGMDDETRRRKIEQEISELLTESQLDVDYLLRLKKLIKAAANEKSNTCD